METNFLIILITILLLSIAVGIMLFRKKRNSKRKGELQKIREGAPFSSQIESFIAPANAGLEKQISRFSLEFGNCKKNHIMYGAYKDSDITISETTSMGWSLAALGRLITQNCTPEKFEASIEEYEKVVIPKYEADISKYESTRKTLLKIQVDKGQRKELGFDYLYWSFQSLSETLEKGILTYANDAGVLPFAFFMQIINDNQGRFDRFIRQGAIMGMIDFFMKYRNNAIIKPYFENLIAARRDMISSDNQMSFFEVRAPKQCTAKQYAAILREILHCANPTIQYCDTEKLMMIAEKEIPGIMDLLINYPLRLIDPGNETLGGFYEFEPYRHAMWVRYTPPLHIGQVQKRYHEVLDMTLPNSSGLNIRLFTDPYAAIPVMFHEYNHYMEDPNEASVHIKTHAFSLKFYRKYKDANPAKDDKFIYLNKLLGKKIDPKKFDVLNRLILNLYGSPKSKTEAEALAEANLNAKNVYIKNNNIEQTWCPEIKMPLLNDAEDQENANLIRKIVIRYAQVPRTVTKEEFKIKRKSFMLLKNSINRKYTKGIYNMLMMVHDKTENNKKITWYANWKSFKDWCINQGYITRYRGNVDIYACDNIEEKTN